MNFVVNLIKRIISKDIQRPLGRWRIENCNTKMNSKIDLSNEDHCGPCGQYAIERIGLKKIERIGLKMIKL